MAKKITVPERTSYRIDHARCGEYFYNTVFESREAAQKHIDERNPKYRDKLTIVEFIEPEHNEYDLGTIRI